jgi:outer membrane protein assembly factor BamB
VQAGQGVANGIAVLEDRYYAASLEQQLLCVARDTGEILWSYQADAADAGRFRQGLMTPVVADDTIYWASHGHDASAFQARTGEIRWHRRLSAPVRTNILLLDEELLVGTEDGLLHRLDRDTGETADLYIVPGTPHGDIVAVGPTLLVFVDWMQPFGELLGLDAIDGQLRWSAAPPDTSKWTTKRPFVMDDRVLVGNHRGEAFAIDLEDGAASPLFELNSTVRSFAWTDRVLYVGTLDGSLRAFRREQ